MAQCRSDCETAISMWKRNYEEGVAHSKKMREVAAEDMQTLLKAERDRLRLLYESEMQAKQSAFELEKAQLTRSF